MSIFGFKNFAGYCRFGAAAALLLFGVCSADQAEARFLTWPSSSNNTVSPLELAQQQADPPQDRSLRPPPTSSAELWSRWLVLLRETGGKISKEQFEQVIGLTLPELREESNGLLRHVLSIDGEHFLIAIVSSNPKQSYNSARIQWRRSTFGDRSQCIPNAQVIEDLAQLGWRLQPSGHHSQSWKEFKIGAASVVYRSSADGCTVAVQTCRYEPPLSPLCSPSQNGSR